MISGKTGIFETSSIAIQQEIIFSFNCIFFLSFILLFTSYLFILNWWRELKEAKVDLM